MNKPHESDWHVAPAYERTVVDAAGKVVAVFDTPEQAQFAAQAPAMARLLFELVDPRLLDVLRAAGVLP